MAIKYKKSAVINDTTANGGARSDVDIQNNSMQNLFPNVTDAERTAGLTRYRKFFVKNETGTLDSARIFQKYLSLGPDYFRLKAGTDSDTQAEADDYTNWAGAGEIDVALTTGSGLSAPFTAEYDVTADGIYDTSLIMVVDLDVPAASEYLTVTGAIAWTGTNAEIDTTTDCQSAHAVKTRGFEIGTADENFDVDGLTIIVSVNGGADQTLTLAGNGQTAAQVVAQDDFDGATMYVSGGTKVAIRTDLYYLANSIQVKSESTADTELGLDNSIHYGTDGTIIATVIELGDVESSHTTPVATTAGDGTFDDSGAPITDDDIGCVTDSWTFTFTSATEFGVVGNLSGALSAGVTTADYSPANEGSYYFVIDKDAWVDTWAAGDTLTFDTVHSAKAAWGKEIVPASSVAYAGNKVGLGLKGEG